MIRLCHSDSRLLVGEVWEAMLISSHTTSIELSWRWLNGDSDIDLGGGWDTAWELECWNNDIWLSIRVRLALAISLVLSAGSLDIVGSWLAIGAISLDVASAGAGGLSIDVARASRCGLTISTISAHSRGDWVD